MTVALTPEQLQWYEARRSSDDLKRDLELTCGRDHDVEGMDEDEMAELAHLCDIQDDDSFAVLLSVIEDHERTYHHG